MNKRILITRPEPLASELAQAIQQLGGVPLLFPIIIIEKFVTSELQQTLQHLTEFDWAIFISPTAVLQAFSQIAASNWPASLKVAAIGEGTAQKLLALGIQVSLVPTEFNSEALLATPEFTAVKNQKMIIFRGEGGRELLAQTLAARGAQLSHAVLYRRVLPAVSNASALVAWKQTGIDVIVISSQEALQNLISFIGEANLAWLYEQCLLVTSPRIKIQAQHVGFRRVYLAKSARNQAIIDALLLI